jgi:hypothetical protein
MRIKGSHLQNAAGVFENFIHTLQLKVESGWHNPISAKQRGE